MWKQEIQDNNADLDVPRAIFPVRKKLRRGLKNCLNDLTQILDASLNKLKIMTNLKPHSNILNFL
jgi:hypothetical protein